MMKSVRTGREISVKNGCALMALTSLGTSHEGVSSSPSNTRRSSRCP
ncbi:MAG: hypothetical protein ACI8XO_003318, partial [Verrucomicrobiales bacterium]